MTSFLEHSTYVHSIANYSVNNEPIGMKLLWVGTPLKINRKFGFNTPKNVHDDVSHSKLHSFFPPFLGLNWGSGEGPRSKLIVNSDSTPQKTYMMMYHTLNYAISSPPPFGAEGRDHAQN